jgi:hypothetical protein
MQVKLESTPAESQHGRASRVHGDRPTSSQRWIFQGTDANVAKVVSNCHILGGKTRLIFTSRFLAAHYKSQPVSFPHSCWNMKFIIYHVCIPSSSHIFGCLNLRESIFIHSCHSFWPIPPKYKSTRFTNNIPYYPNNIPIMNQNNCKNLGKIQPSFPCPIFQPLESWPWWASHPSLVQHAAWTWTHWVSAVGESMFRQVMDGYGPFVNLFLTFFFRLVLVFGFETV